MREYITKEAAQKCLDDLSSDNLIGNENDTFISLAEAKDKIEELPTADVVPRSEVEALEEEIKRLQSVLNNYALRYGTVRDQRAVIDNAKADVAKEIFEEIGKILRRFDEIAERDKSEYGELIVGDITANIAELKKKYMEGK